MSICSNCKHEISDAAAFCPYCGSPVTHDRQAAAKPARLCVGCGREIGEAAAFCPYCGAKNPLPSNANIFGKVTQTINHMAGGTGAVKLRLGDLFTDVFKKHSRDEGEEKFICGTERTTPPLASIDASWPKPWLYSRVLLVFLIAFLLLDLCYRLFSNLNTVPGVIFLGSFMIPVSLLVFFFELNIPRNISFFSVLKFFLIGGCASLVVTLMLCQIFPVEKLDYLGAIVTGIVEEIGKLAIVAALIKKMSYAKYYVSGLLIGATVGAGFAAFESAGYAFRSAINYGYGSMMETIILRAVLAPGGHIAWAAITGVALMIAMDGEPLQWKHLVNPRFLKLFTISVVLHAIWDMPIEFGSNFYLVQIILTVASWIVILVLISRCLSQLSGMISSARAAAAVPVPVAVPFDEPAQEFTAPQAAEPIAEAAAETAPQPENDGSQH